MTKHLFRISALIILPILLFSCGTPAGAKISTTKAGNTLIVTGSFSAVILTKEFLDANAPRTPPSEYWTPEVNQVLHIESNLEEYLAQNNSAFNSGRAPNQEKLSTYGRQYIGIISGEKRGILGMFFCYEFSKDFDWKNQRVDVMGGGDCFFGVWYDPETQEFISVAANSPK